jgi:hypothetical protein
MKGGEKKWQRKKEAKKAKEKFLQAEVTEGGSLAWDDSFLASGAHRAIV